MVFLIQFYSRTNSLIILCRKSLLKNNPNVRYKTAIAVISTSSTMINKDSEKNCYETNIFVCYDQCQLSLVYMEFTAIFKISKNRSTGYRGKLMSKRVLPYCSCFEELRTRFKTIKVRF
jgi:hypothetical protein